ncbi:MAG: hypothetical protein RMK84_04480 [Oscillochloridaceae bacterium]|nr:hypothetical protein [Chloroflexaceae bacterium]MDW8389360.1 hypothetical protein [Oscillochloridaceae bacterium]
MVIAVIGLIVSIIMLIVGIAVIAARGEMRGNTYTREGAQLHIGAEDNFGQKRAGAHVFHGVEKGVRFEAEMSTAELLALLANGRLREAWPWALAALGLLLIFFWGPLLIGLLAGWKGPGLWAFVGFFFLGALWAAYPRRRGPDESSEKPEGEG